MAAHRIMLVEDNPADVALLLEALEGRDIAVECHSQPKDALAVMLSGSATAPIDLVVLDYTMPGMTGLEWLTRVRSYPRFAELPIVVWTGSANPREAERLRMLDAAIQPKPGTYQEVLEFCSYLGLKLEKARRRAAERSHDGVDSALGF